MAKPARGPGKSQRRRPSLFGRLLRFASLVATGSAATLAAPGLLRRLVSRGVEPAPRMVGGGRAPAAFQPLPVATAPATPREASPAAAPDAMDSGGAQDIAPAPVPDQAPALPEFVAAHLVEEDQDETGRSSPSEDIPTSNLPGAPIPEPGGWEQRRRSARMDWGTLDPVRAEEATRELAGDAASADTPAPEPAPSRAQPVPVEPEQQRRLARMDWGALHPDRAEGVIPEWRPEHMEPFVPGPAEAPADDDGDEGEPPDARGIILPWRPESMTVEPEAASEGEAPPATVRRRRVSRVYYGWVVTAAAAIGFAVSAGIGNWAFGAFVRPLEAEFGWSRGEVSAAASIGMAAILVCSMPCGWWVDRWGARSAIIFGAIGTAIGFALLARVQTLWQFYAAFGLTALCRTFTTYVPLIAVVGHWFPGTSGRAMGFMMAGLGMGGVVFAPVATALIEAFGWRQAYLLLGLVIGGYFVPIALFILRSPRRSIAERGAASEAPLEGWLFGEALRSPAFWLLNVAIGLMWMGQLGFISHGQPLFEWREYAPETAALFVGLAALLATITRLFAGWLYERLGRPALFSVVMGTIAAVGLAALLPAVTQFTLIIFFAAWGLGSGAMVLLAPTLTADSYGQRSLGKLLAFTEVVGGVGSVSGPIVGGVLYDSTGSYVPAFSVYMGATLLAGLALALFVKAHRARPASQAREVRGGTEAIPEPG